MYPIPPGHKFTPLGPTARFGTCVSNGIQLRVEWFDMLPRPEYKAFLELICCDAAVTGGRLFDEVHIRSQLHPSSMRRVNGVLRRVPDDWHVTVDFGGGPAGTVPKSAHVYAGPDMEKGRQDVNPQTMGIHRPGGRPVFEWYDIREKSPFFRQWNRQQNQQSSSGGSQQNNQRNPYQGNKRNDRRDNNGGPSNYQYRG